MQSFENLELIRLDDMTSGATLDDLYSQWAIQIAQYGDSIEQFAAPYIHHARDICSKKDDEKFRIYALKGGDQFYAFMHIYWSQIPGVKNWTIRINWIQTCPRYEYEDLESEFVAHAVATIMKAAYEMALYGEFGQCSLIKIRIGNSYDRSYWKSYMAMMDVAKPLEKIKKYSMAGSWIHLDL